MKKTDIGVVGFMYAVCAFFFLMSRDLKKGARIYPLCIIAILFLLTTGYVVEMLFAAKKNGVTSGIPEIFEGFQPKQFFIVLGMLIAYLAGMYFVGFYLATIVLMAASLLYLRVPKWQILVSTIVIIGLVYGAFTMFLGVKLPVGLLFK
ncbi:tripartite tricarboxylate transporter TctB family protein [Dysosmobacter sp.]|uniref:tripartite tricarboxylate transporter TctB family protein n=1 Tax=Dysosmobacter sp. TaxID=2591382 RepID=UPI00307B5DE1